MRDLLYQGISIAVFNDLISHVLRALGRLHDAGLFHGDLKPENIVVDDDGEVFLLDGAPDVRSLDIKLKALVICLKGRLLATRALNLKPIVYRLLSRTDFH